MSTGRRQFDGKSTHTVNIKETIIDVAWPLCGSMNETTLFLVRISMYLPGSAYVCQWWRSVLKTTPN